MEIATFEADNYYERVPGVQTIILFKKFHQ